jgi:SAM-dependent methyltransferase
MRRRHAQLVQHERERPTGHVEGYAGYLSYLRDLRDDFERSYWATRVPRMPGDNEVIAAFDDPPPEDLARAYDLTPEAMAHLARTVQRKYMVHFKNIRRSWALMLQYMPELMAEGAERQSVLEMSTAHGATLEILRRKGHAVTGNDFAAFFGTDSPVDSRLRRAGEIDLTGLPDKDGLNAAGAITRWPYQPIIESLGLDVRLFDAGNPPYPFEDRSFDTVLCFDAIEHYCHPRDWMTIVAEFTRLARKSVLVVINPLNPFQDLAEVPGYAEAHRAFQREMRAYNARGFRCVLAGMHRHQVSVFKLMRTGALHMV